MGQIKLNSSYGFSLKDNIITFKNHFTTGPYTQASFQGMLASEYYLEYGKKKNLMRKKFYYWNP